MNISLIESIGRKNEVVDCSFIKLVTFFFTMGFKNVHGKALKYGMKYTDFRRGN